MSAVLVLKLIHVLSAIVAVGANVTYAFWLRRAGRSRDQLVFAIGGVRTLDRAMANPAYAVLLVTGILLVSQGQYSFQAGWLATAIVLYVVTAILGVAVYAPAIRRQLAEAARDPTTPAYEAAAARSTMLGLATTVIVVVIVALMVTKPY